MRRRRTRTAAGWLALAVVVTVATACSSGAEAAVPGTRNSGGGTLVITSGNVTGVYYAWSQELMHQLKATNPRLRVKVEKSGGSVDNLQRLQSGTADLALTTVDATEPEIHPLISPRAADASDFVLKSTEPLRALGRIYDDYVQIVVRADSDLHSVADLAGHRVAVGEPGSGVRLISDRVLLAAGVSVRGQPLGVADGTAALSDKKVDAVFWSGGIPTPSIEELAAHTDVRLIPLGELAGALRTRFGAVYRPATIPPGRYRGTEEVATVASANLLVARADADPSIVEAVLSTIFDQRDAIGTSVPAANATDRRTAILTGGLDLHPAAMEYYRRTKP